mmetsp:Transcript_86145/g.248750  ORF Transcript_86145/g.248750 Transcript_86145/m.248750 type:complete len:569 (-) Transcript_86145:282-1988(-)
MDCPARSDGRCSEPCRRGLLVSHRAVVHLLLPLHASLRLLARMGRRGPLFPGVAVLGRRHRVTRARNAELYRFLHGRVLLRCLHCDVHRARRHSASEQFRAWRGLHRHDRQPVICREIVRRPQLHHLYTQPLAGAAASAFDADRSGSHEHGSASRPPEAGLGLPGFHMGGAEGAAREGELAGPFRLSAGGVADDCLPEAGVPCAVSPPLVRGGFAPHHQLLDGCRLSAVGFHNQTRCRWCRVVLLKGGHGGHFPHREGAEMGSRGGEGRPSGGLLRRGGLVDGSEAHLVGDGADVLRMLHAPQERYRRGHGPRPQLRRYPCHVHEEGVEFGAQGDVARRSRKVGQSIHDHGGLLRVDPVLYRGPAAYGCRRASRGDRLHVVALSVVDAAPQDLGLGSEVVVDRPRSGGAWHRVLPAIHAGRVWGSQRRRGQRVPRELVDARHAAVRPELQHRRQVRQTCESEVVAHSEQKLPHAESGQQAAEQRRHGHVQRLLRSRKDVHGQRCLRRCGSAGDIAAAASRRYAGAHRVAARGFKPAGHDVGGALQLEPQHGRCRRRRRRRGQRHRRQH